MVPNSAEWYQIVPNSTKHCRYSSISYPYTAGSPHGACTYHQVWPHHSHPQPQQSQTSAFPSKVPDHPTVSEFDAIKAVVNDMKVKLLQLETKVKSMSFTTGKVSSSGEHVEEVLRTVEAEIHTPMANVSVASIDGEVDTIMTESPPSINQLN